MTVLSFEEVIEYIKTQQIHKIDGISLIFFLWSVNNESLHEHLTEEEIINLENSIVNHNDISAITVWMEVYTNNNCNIPKIIKNCKNGNDLITLFIEGKSYYRLIYQKLLELNDEKNIAFLMWYSYVEEFAGEIIEYILYNYPKHIVTLYNDIFKRKNELEDLPDYDIVTHYNPPDKQIIISNNIDQQDVRECKEYARDRIKSAELMLDEYVTDEFKHYVLGVVL